MIKFLGRFQRKQKRLKFGSSRVRCIIKNYITDIEILLAGLGTSGLDLLNLGIPVHSV